VQGENNIVNGVKGEMRGIEISKRRLFWKARNAFWGAKFDDFE
jgi:hypothetical protein